MALLSDLVRIVAAVEGLDEVSVGIFARAARESGYISQGGRGRSAAKMTVKDAANLLIAVNGCALAKEVHERINQYRDLVAAKRNRSEIEIGRDGRLFGEDLERLIEMMAPEFTGFTFVEVPSPIILQFKRPIISVEFSVYSVEDGVTVGHHGHWEAEKSGRASAPDRSDLTIISAKTIRAIAEAL